MEQLCKKTSGWWQVGDVKFWRGYKTCFSLEGHKNRKDFSVRPGRLKKTFIFYMFSWFSPFRVLILLKSLALLEETLTKTRFRWWQSLFLWIQEIHLCVTHTVQERSMSDSIFPNERRYPVSLLRIASKRRQISCFFYHPSAFIFHWGYQSDSKCTSSIEDNLRKKRPKDGQFVSLGMKSQKNCLS